MNFMNFIKSLILKHEPHDFSIVPFERNEPCFCKSGLKYKKCHALKLEPHNKIACKIINHKDKEVKIEIFERNSIKFQSNLRWCDIGVSDTSKIE